jgi:restriction endonuclease S subunit
MADRLKKGWRTWRFDQMAVMVNDRIDNPSEAGVDRYVGLEHLDANSLTIRRWGSPSDVEATKLRFRAGDIILGRRRVYQRKLGVPDFDGICSAHAMVLRARPEVTLPEFLPFFMQSDLFMERAKQISVGSLSPTINWKTLAAEQFALPPLDEQRRIAEVLGAIRSAHDLYSRVSGAIAAAMQALIVDFLHVAEGTVNPSLLEEYAKVSYGLTVDPGRRECTVQIPYLRVANVQRGALDLTEIKTVGMKRDDDAYRLVLGDVLVVEGHADATQIGRAAVWMDEHAPMYHQNHLIRARCGDDLDPAYLCLIINSVHGQSYFRGHAKSTSGLNTINSSVVKRYLMPIPSREVQSAFVEKARSVERRLRDVAQRQDTLAMMSRDLLGQIGGDGR